MRIQDGPRSEFERNGFVVVDEALLARQVEELIAAIEAVKGESPAGLRQPHVSIRAVAELVESAAIRGLAEAVLGSEARVVRSILFDKTAASNWAVPWHQDLTIAVCERREAHGFTGWSVKDGIHHVQAPREMLEQMLTMRLHLDDCGAESGPLRVLPGTHRHGWLDTETINRLKREIPEHVCVVPRGGALLMRPLLLHASSKATRAGHRRVLHLEFSAAELADGLRFFSR